MPSAAAAGTTTSAGLVAALAERPHQFGKGGLGVATGPDQPGDGGLEDAVPLAAGDVQLHLDFPEPPRRILVVRHRDRVVDDLGQKLPVHAPDLDRAPDGGEAGHRLEGQGPGGGEHQVGGRIGHPVERALEADLPADQIRTPVVLGELHRPGGPGLTAAVPHGDAGTSQAQVSGVVVGGVQALDRQHPRRGPGHEAVQVGNGQPGWRHELRLPFDVRRPPLVPGRLASRRVLGGHGKDGRQRREVDDGVVGAEAVGHVGVGVPVVLPAVPVEEVAETVRPTRLEHDGQGEATVSAPVHHVVVPPTIRSTPHRWTAWVAPTAAGRVKVTDAVPHRSIDLIITPPRLADTCRD